MKIKVRWILFLGICIMGYNFIFAEVSSVKAVNLVQEQSTIAYSNLKIINAVSTVKLGETGIITIQGAPITQYNIKTSYKIENKTIRVIQWRTTDRTGVATFNWIVDKDTTSGTYAATISGAGYEINTSHTVLK